MTVSLVNVKVLGYKNQGHANWTPKNCLTMYLFSISPFLVPPRIGWKSQNNRSFLPGHTILLLSSYFSNPFIKKKLFSLFSLADLCLFSSLVRLGCRFSCSSCLSVVVVLPLSPLTLLLCRCFLFFSCLVFYFRALYNPLLSSHPCLSVPLAGDFFPWGFGFAFVSLSPLFTPPIRTTRTCKSGKESLTTPI